MPPVIELVLHSCAVARLHGCARGQLYYSTALATKSKWRMVVILGVGEGGGAVAL